MIQKPHFFWRNYNAKLMENTHKGSKCCKQRLTSLVITWVSINLLRWKRFCSYGQAACGRVPGLGKHYGMQSGIFPTGMHAVCNHRQSFEWRGILKAPEWWRKNFWSPSRTDVGYRPLFEPPLEVQVIWVPTLDNDDDTY